MSSRWSHRTCERCWFGRPGTMWGGGYRQPVQVIDMEPGGCCYCDQPTVAGIFTRADPDPGPNADAPYRVVCGGDHDSVWTVEGGIIRRP